MDARLIDSNKQLAVEMMNKLGYAPNPLCEQCNGFGRVHPVGYEGRPNYSEVVMCRAKGCMQESYDKRRL